MTEGVTTRPARYFTGSKIGSIALRWVVFACAIGVWELLTRSYHGQKAADFTPPSQIAREMYHLWLTGPANHLFLTHAVRVEVAPSVARVLGGWAIAVVIAIAVGIPVGRARTLREYLDPLIQFARAIPPPALIPIFIVFFKLGTTMRLAVIVFGVLWPILLNTIEGARAVDPVKVDTAAVFHLSLWQRLRGIILPAAAPKIWAGLRVSLAMALIIMVISEAIGATSGIGFSLNDASEAFDTPRMWAYIALLGILGYVFNGALVMAERWALRNHGRRR